MAIFYLYKTEYFLISVLEGCYMDVTHKDVEIQLDFNINKEYFDTCLVTI